MEVAMGRPDVVTADNERPAPISELPFFVSRNTIYFWYHHPAVKTGKARYQGPPVNTPIGETIIRMLGIFRELEIEVDVAHKERDELQQKNAELQGQLASAAKQIIALKSKKRGA